MGCPGGMRTIRYTRSVFTRALWANFKSSYKKIIMGKKIVELFLDVTMIAFFP